MCLLRNAVYVLLSDVPGAERSLTKRALEGKPPEGSWDRQGFTQSFGSNIASAHGKFFKGGRVFPTLVKAAEVFHGGSVDGKAF